MVLLQKMFFCMVCRKGFLLLEEESMVKLGVLNVIECIVLLEICLLVAISRLMVHVPNLGSSLLCVQHESLNYFHLPSDRVQILFLL